MLGDIYGAFDPLIDRVAEGKRALAVAADARPSAVVANADLPNFPEGLLSDHEVLSALLEQYRLISDRLQSRIKDVDDDPVTPGSLDRRRGQGRKRYVDAPRVRFVNATFDALNREQSQGFNALNNPSM